MASRLLKTFMKYFVSDMLSNIYFRTIYPPGSVTLFGLNVFSKDITVTIGGELETESVATYILSAHAEDNGLLSQ